MKRTFCRRLGTLVLSAAMIFSAIPAAAAEGDLVPDPDAVTVTLTAEKTQLLIGEKTKVTAKATKGDAEATITQAMYSSADTSVEVSNADNTTGEVKAVNEGAATIKAVCEVEGQSYEATCQVTVNRPSAQRVELSPSGTLVKEVGEQPFEVTATVYPPEADDTVTWNSEDRGTADVDSKGIVTIVGPGRTLITATAGNVTSDPLELSVSGIRMANKLSLLVGESETLSYEKCGNAEQSVITWKSNNISIADVREGKISAYNPGTAEITATAGNYKATCFVEVRENTASAVTGSMRVGEKFAFSDIMGELDSKAREQIGTSLESISGLTVSPRQGILYYGYSSPDVPGSGVGGMETYYVAPPSGQKKLSDVVFVPSSDFGGTAVISYTGHGAGKTFNGRIQIAVENTDDVAYNTAEDRAIAFDAPTFTNVHRAKTGKVLNYVTFQLPPESKGILYYNYSPTSAYSQRVTTQTKYYVSGGSILLDNVSFLPAKGFTGTVTIPYTGVDTSGFSTSGRITITVYRGGEQGDGSITYQVASGGSVRFDGEDFQRVCRDRTGTSLNYIYLTQPDDSKGKLYYKYTSANRYDSVVSGTTKYFRNSNPRISYVDFVAADGFTGTVTVPYTGYGSTGERFEGEILIRAGGKDGAIHYTTTNGSSVQFSGFDFNEACQDSNGVAMDYVRFELPASSRGTLYYNYTSSSRPGTRVSEHTRYSLSDLSRISFVPKNDFYGTVTIPFSGSDDKGARFSGTVEIRVDQGTGDETISYTTVSGGAVAFDEGDFNRVCRTKTGESLEYVRFDLPNSRYGTLYERYDSNRGKGSAVHASTNYYRSGSSHRLGDVSFVANKTYTGSIEISYHGRSSSGKSFDGVVKVTISDNRAKGVSYYTSSLPVRFSAADFRNACAGRLSGTLSYIEIETAPSSVYGKLLQNYQGARTGTAVASGSRYYDGGNPAIGDLTFLAKAGYRGTVSIPYTAVDTRGNSVKGSVEIHVSNGNLSTHFTDLGHYGWAAPSIEFLRDSGIVNGYSATTYGPAGRTSRGAFTMMVCRMFDFPMRSGTAFRDVPADSVYASAVLTAKELGIVSGNNGSFYPEHPITRQQAVVMLERAMRAAGWSVTSASPSVLDGYGDGNQVSGYARNAMASMIRMGILNGDQSGRLNPHRAITRAEIAVILHRLLTV